jgi:glyoxylate/hydroxypyruvate reductase A
MSNPTLLFLSELDDPAAWRPALAAAMPDVAVRVWPEPGDDEDVVAALVWKPPAGLLRRFPRLRVVVNLGAGVDAILADPTLPDVPLCRLVDPGLTRSMAAYVALHCLSGLREMPELAAQQRRAEWRFRPPRDAADFPVGLLGLGEMGQAAAAALSAFGFPLRGWSRRGRRVPGVTSFSGTDGLAPFLDGLAALVLLVPLTAETQGMVDAALLRRLPRGACLINASRGPVVVERDLLAALDDGHVAHATLDVFEQEPLPREHPFWAHPRVTVTPHNAGLTAAATAAPTVAEVVQAVLAGTPPPFQVDRANGY